MFKADQVETIEDGLGEMPDFEGDDIDFIDFDGLGSGSGLLDLIAEEREAPFKYDAMTPSGQTVSGTVSAKSSTDAIGKIRAKNYFPTKVSEQKQPKAKREPKIKAPKPSGFFHMLGRLFFALILLVVAYAAGFLTCYILMAK
jgi:hypothetical protein